MLRRQIRLNRISSDPQPNTTSPTILCKPPQEMSRFPGINANTHINRAQPPPTNPFDQRTPPRARLPNVGELRVKQTKVTPCLPSNPCFPSHPANLPYSAPSTLQPPAPPILQPPAPPILQPGWEHCGSVPDLAAGPQSKVAAAHGRKGWNPEPAPHLLHQPKLEKETDGSLSQQLVKMIAP